MTEGMKMETVSIPRAELFEMLDVIDEMVRWCSVHMPSDRYNAVSRAHWVISHRAAGDDQTADSLKQELLNKRAKSP